VGHIIRWRKKGSHIKVLMGKFNKRSVEKPRIKWEDMVPRDALRILGIRHWRKRTGDTEEWRGYLREVRV
jgi:hypothetical protein